MDSSNGLEYSALFNALDNGDMLEVHEELQRNPEAVKERDDENRVPLHYAADCADLETFRKIFELDPSLIDAQDEAGFTPLLIAVMAGNVEVVEFLVQRGAQLVHLDRNKHTAVHWAVVCAQMDTLICLVKYGAACNTPDIYGAYPLHYATVIEDAPSELSESILHLLLKEGANVNCVDMDGRTPLIWAASNGKTNALKSLIQAGANINSVKFLWWHKMNGKVDRDRLNALHCAASHGHLEIIRILIDCNQREAINDCNGDTPLFYASTFGHYECVKILVENGANVNHLDKRIRSAAHCAAAKGQLRILRLLKQYGASFELQNHRGDLPLHEAVQTGSKELVEWFLLLAPKSASTPNFHGRTPLHLAAANGNMELVVLLCQRDVPINPLMLYKNELFTPLDVAERRENDLIVEYLRGRHNAKKAMEISQEERRLSWVDIEETLKTAKLRKIRARISEEDEEFLGNQNARNRRQHGKWAKNRIRGKKSIQSDSESGRIGDQSMDSGNFRRRSSSATGSFYTDCVPKATSTTDLPNIANTTNTNNKNKSSRISIQINNNNEEEEEQEEEEEKFLAGLEQKLVESTIQKIVQDELRKQAEEEKKRDAINFEKGENLKENIPTGGNLKNHLKNKRQNDNKNEDVEKDGGSVSDDGTFLTNQSLNGEEAPIATTSSSIPKTKSSRKSTDSQKKVKLSSNSPVEIPNTNSDTKKKTSIKTNIAQPLELHIFEYGWQPFNGHEEDLLIERRFIHEKAIFEELTHLKRMQIQYGKIQERILLRSLIQNFCKMHAINPAHFRAYQTFYDWEKFLYGLLSDQLKLIYMKERDRIQNVAALTNVVANNNNNQHQRYISSSRLFATPFLKFENRLHKTVPLDERLRELTRIYSSSTNTGRTRNSNGISGHKMTSTRHLPTNSSTQNSSKKKPTTTHSRQNSRKGREPTEKSLNSGGKRCECLGKHLLIT